MQRTQSAAQAVDLHLLSALGGIRTPNLLIRSQTASDEVAVDACREGAQRK